MAAVDINRGSTGVAELLPTAISSEIWGTVIDASAVMAAARQVPLPGAGIAIPMVLTDPEAQWTEETEEKAVARGTVGSKVMRAHTLAVIVPFSNQFRRDLPGLYAELVRRLPLALGKKFDETVFGVGAAPGDDFDQLDGSPAMSVGADSSFTDLAAIVNAIAAAGGDLSAWVVNSAVYGTMLTSVDMLGRPYFAGDPSTSRSVGSVFGAPVYKTRAGMPEGGAGAADDTTGVAGDWAGSAIWGSVEGVKVAIADQATLHDGATTINLFQRNMFAVRAEIEVGFRVRDDQHFVRLTA